MELPNWGRSTQPCNNTKIVTLLLPFIAHSLVFIFFFLTYTQYSFTDFVKSPTNNFSWYIFKWIFAYLIYQLFLSVLPDVIHIICPSYQGGINVGQRTPAGNLLKYNINGLQSWLITHILFITFSYLDIIRPSLIAKNWIEIFLGANIIGFFLPFLAYFKAMVFPTHKEDNKFTGIFYYDFVMGIEFNPRIFNIDMKLFFNGRPGIIGWTIINLSFAVYQYEKYGFVANSMILANILQALYVLDFFWNEEWYLRTVDIAHDHFGWMLAFGDCVWLPFMYTLQTGYLSSNVVILPNVYFWSILILGVVGYIIFRLANYQKNMFRKIRKKDEDMTIFNKPAKYIFCHYKTKNGERHESSLLISGLWGTARHLNYTGDLILSLSYCLTCGFDSIIPYFYIVYMIILLTTRCWRDEHRCKNKYGANWDKYCRIVPYRFVPLIY